MLNVSGSSVGPNGTTINRFLNNGSTSAVGQLANAPNLNYVNYSTSGAGNFESNKTGAVGVYLNRNSNGSLSSISGIYAPWVHTCDPLPGSSGGNVVNEGNYIFTQTANGIQVTNNDTKAIWVVVDPLTNQLYAIDSTNSGSIPPGAKQLAAGANVTIQTNGGYDWTTAAAASNGPTGTMSISQAAATMNAFQNTWAYYSKQSGGDGYTQGTLGGLESIISGAEAGDLRIFGWDSSTDPNSQDLVNAAQELITAYNNGASGVGSAADTAWYTAMASGVAIINSDGSNYSNTTINQFLSVWSGS